MRATVTRTCRWCNGTRQGQQTEDGGVGQCSACQGTGRDLEGQDKAELDRLAQAPVILLVLTAEVPF